MVLLLGWVRNVLTLILDVYVDFPGMLRVVNLIVGFIVLRSLRQWAREKGTIHARLQNFTVRLCACASEEDRPVVYRNIAALMRATLPDVDLTDDDDALEAFDNLVRADLPLAFSSSFGKTVMPYKYVAAVMTTWDGPWLLDRLAGLHNGMPIREAMSEALYFLPLCFSIMPLFVNANERVSSCFLHLRGWREILWLLLGYALAVLPNVVLVEGALKTLKNTAVESDIAMLLLVITDILLVLMAVFVFAEPCRRRRCTADVDINIDIGIDATLAEAEPQDRHEEPAVATMVVAGLYLSDIAILVVTDILLLSVAFVAVDVL
eukprot:CAMPEP_0204190578 /NCGR_PEP_ID=MMETSP0361-20130328/59419_1 /ASSEMBLY_ACC=CAM_ASM_000343 /TAXON_ID=268821 /ORGANISM="Scrippsiella Hangoei, Strain SHTV-5" /LENGTH=320 /DNA_ID=CAMNT_0051151413 /DNA_START=120 /DNA_END=1083 /DNA_ORIENTATION=-